MREIARLLLPSVHWDDARGFASAKPAVMRALADGIAGFVIEGGTCDAVAELAADIHRNAEEAPIIAVAPLALSSPAWRDHPLPLPPAGAIASLRDHLAIRRAATAVAREVLRAGCNTILAPSCDVAVPPSADSFARDASDVAVAGAEWIDAARAEGVLCIAGQFPGGGRASNAPGNQTEIVRDSDDALYASDLVPFRAAIDAGVAGLLVSNAAYSSLDRTESPAPLSAPILMGLLRRQLGFDGLAVADAASLNSRRGGGIGARDLVRAGIDLVLRPANVDLELHAMMYAVQAGQLDRERVHEAARRRRSCAEMAGSPTTSSGIDDDAVWLDEVAERAISVVRGRAVRVVSPIEVVAVGVMSQVVPDLVMGFAKGIADAGGDASNVRQVAAPSSAVHTTLVVVAASDDQIASESVVDAIDSLCAAARALRRDVVVVWCGHPATAPAMPAASLAISSWSRGATMIRAAGRWLVRRV